MSPSPRKKKARSAPPSGESLPSLPDGLTPQEVQRQLEKVLASETFQRAERLSRFLRHAVEQGLAGQENKLKEYAIGLQVFDKPESFDTRVDPIVRVEAGRLRAKVRDYYESEGKNDPVWLGLRKRGYRPLFRRQQVESAVAERRQQKTTTPPPEPSDSSAIAVLPFHDLSPEGTQEYFCDGITQEIINALAKVKGLSVAARTSAAQFKGEAKDVREIARQLQVGRVLEGSVQKIGRQVRISVHLVDAATGFDCWAETYDRPLDDVLAIQDDVSQAIAAALREEAEAGSATPKPPAASKAHARYLRALDHWERRTEDDIKKAVRFFREAVRENPNHAAAHAGLANSFISLAISEAMEPLEAFTQAREAAEHAITIDDQLAEAYAALGALRAFEDRDWAAAEQAFRHAMECNPYSSTPHHWLALVCFLPEGRFDEALAEFQFALERDQTSVILHSHLGLLLHMKGDHQQAVRRLRLAVDLDPDFYGSHWALGKVFVQMGEAAEAKKCFEHSRDLSGGAVLGLAGLASAYARSNEPDRARALIEELEQLASSSYVCPCNFAEIHAALGDDDKAFESLGRAERNRSPRLSWVNVDPSLAPLRRDTRFRSLVDRLGLAQRPHEATEAQAV